jgi:hypothetical protein
MSSAILACERTTHPLLLHCLQDLDHDWRRLQLVNSTMAAAFRLYTQQVAAHTSKREQLKQRCAAMSAELGFLNHQVSTHRRKTLTYMCVADPNWEAAWDALEQAIRVRERREREDQQRRLHAAQPQAILDNIYANHIFDAVFVISARVAGLVVPAGRASLASPARAVVPAAPARPRAAVPLLCGPSNRARSAIATLSAPAPALSPPPPS